MATLKLVLDKRRIKKSGAFPLVIRIRHDGKYVDVQTGHELLPYEFDDNKQLARNKPALNKELKKLLEECVCKIDELNFHHEHVSLDMIKALFKKEMKVVPTISAFWQEEARRLTEIGKSGNARVYLTAYTGLKRVMNLEITFRDLKLHHLIEAETQLLKNGVKPNTLSLYMRTLRAICNKAILLELVDQSWYPFFRYKIKKGKSTPRVLSLGDMQRYFALDIPENHPHFRSYSIGKLIFLLRGINLKDLVKLTKENVRSGRICYERSKTKTLYDIGLTEEIHELLKVLHQGGKTLVGAMDSEAQLIDSDNAVLRKYNQYLHVVNNHLRKLGEQLKFETRLSTYVMRYSYANIARSLGISVEEISYLLGHKSSAHAVTEIYLTAYDADKLDELNSRIIDAVTGK
jgi:integrase/recombinase XerD